MSLNIPNLDKLIAVLRTVPPTRFNMRAWFSHVGEPAYRIDIEIAKNECGTAACIAGWCSWIRGEQFKDEDIEGEWLGLNADQRRDLFFGGTEALDEIPLPRAIDALCHLRDTGEVRWDLFPAESYRGQPWSIPQAVELSPPALPAEITRLLAPVAVTEGAGHE